MYHGATSKVDGAHLLQEAAAPHPVCHRKIGYDHPQQCEHHIAFKLDALGKGTQDKGWCDEGKHTLKHNKSDLGYARRHEAFCGDAMQEGFIPATDDACQCRPFGLVAGVEGPAVSEGHPQYAYCAHDKHGLHHDAQHIFLSYQSTIKQGNAWYRH